MKKAFFLIMAVLALLLVSGCTKIEDLGEYKEGTYFGSALDEGSVATALIYVDENGNIKSVYLDTTYEKDGVATTKKTLGEDYGMRKASPISKEWYEQVELLEKAILKEQGLNWVVWKDDEKTETDSVSGVTMKIGALYKATSEALNMAK